MSTTDLNEIFKPLNKAFLSSLVKVLNSSMHRDGLFILLEWIEPPLLSVLGPKLKSESPQEVPAAL